MVEASFSCLERVQIAYQRRSGSHARLLCVRAETSGELANATLNPSSIRGQCIASPFRSQDLFWILSGTSAYNVSLLMRGPQNLELLEPKMPTIASVAAGKAADLDFCSLFGFGEGTRKWRPRFEHQIRSMGSLRL